MKVKIVLVFIAMIILVMCLSIPVNASTWDKEIKKGTHWVSWGESKDITITVDIICKNNTLIDVYWMNTDEYEKYKDNQMFTPKVAKEKIKSINFTWKVPDDKKYHLVIDNLDNARNSDAIPEMDVVVEVYYNNVLIIGNGEESFEINEYINIISIVVFIIILIYIVIIILLRKKKKQRLIQPQRTTPTQLIQQIPKPYQTPIQIPQRQMPYIPQFQSQMQQQYPQQQYVQQQQFPQPRRQKPRELIQVECPNCDEIIDVNSPERPIIITCLKCGAKGILKE